MDYRSIWKAIPEKDKRKFWKELVVALELFLRQELKTAQDDADTYSDLAELINRYNAKAKTRDVSVNNLVIGKNV